MCAYPECKEPLVFRDRNRSTIVAEIAPIRSEQPGGPRHDAAYPGDLNGPANLILLCGKHHRPVDRHEEAYTIEELERWKFEQRNTAGAGTVVTESDARFYARLSSNEQQIIMSVARWTDQVISACRVAQGSIDALRAMQENERKKIAWMGGPMYEVGEDGERGEPINDRTQLPYVDQQRWLEKEHAAVQSEHPRIRQALTDLSGEVAVLRMISEPLGQQADLVMAATNRALLNIGDGAAVESAACDARVATSQLWQIANGE